MRLLLMIILIIPHLTFAQLESIPKSIIRSYFETFDQGIPRTYWSILESSNKSWEVDTNENNSIRSGSITDNENSQIRFSGFFLQGQLSFDYKVLSENTAGTFQVLIDGQEVLTEFNQSQWKSFEYELDRGVHEIIFAFKIDQVHHYLINAAWVDNVKFE